MSEIYDNWKTINETNNHIISEKNLTIQYPEYFNSVVYQQFHGMKFKIINEDLVIVKVNTIMGKYNCVQ